MMEGEGVREQGTGEPGGKEVGGSGRRRQGGGRQRGRGQIRWDWFCHNVVQEAGGNAAAPKQRDAPAAPRPCSGKTLIFPRKRRSLPTIFNPLQQTSRPLFKQSIANCFFLVPGLSNRSSRKGSRLRFISATPNIAPGANKCVWFPQAALNRAVAPPSIHRWLPPASPGAVQLRRGVYSSIVAVFSRIKT